MYHQWIDNLAEIDREHRCELDRIRVGWIVEYGHCINFIRQVMQIVLRAELSNSFDSIDGLEQVSITEAR